MRGFSLSGFMGVSGFIKGLNGFYGNKPRIKLYPFGFHIQSRELSHSQDLNADDSILPVLIIGAGPVGLVLSIFLTKLGTY